MILGDVISRSIRMKYNRIQGIEYNTANLFIGTDEHGLKVSTALFSWLFYKVNFPNNIGRQGSHQIWPLPSNVGRSNGPSISLSSRYS